MANRHYTDEERAELLNNPYTARISECKVTFTLEFKKMVLDNIDRPGMTAAKVFELAGYRRELFSDDVRRNNIRAFRKEAASPEGLQEPKPLKCNYDHRKKHSETEFRELQERVILLEQQLDFLKKSYALKRRSRSKPPDSSN